MEYTPEQVNQHIDKFTDITPATPIPSNVKLTVYCESHKDRGFLMNIFEHEIGLELLIAEKFILQSDLKTLIDACNPNTRKVGNYKNHG